MTSCIDIEFFKKLSDYIETLVIYYFQFIQRILLNNYKLIKCITSKSESEDCFPISDRVAAGGAAACWMLKCECYDFAFPLSATFFMNIKQQLHKAFLCACGLIILNLLLFSLQLNKFFQYLEMDTVIPFSSLVQLIWSFQN